MGSGRNFAFASLPRVERRERSCDGRRRSRSHCYIDAAARATTRARDVLVLIIIVSVLIFGAFWNSRQGSWINERLQSTAAVVALHKLQAARGAATDPQVKATLDKQIAAATAKTDEYLELRPHLNDPDVARTMLTKLEELQIQNVLFLRLPFFGLMVDVNDLGMLGGFAFSLLLLWFRFALWHERANLEMTFAEAATHRSRQFVYEALSMHQVLTVPRRLNGATPVSNWSYAVKGLFLLPLLVHITVFCFDCFSFRRGWSISPLNTIVGTAVSGLFLLAIASLTFLSFTLSAENDATWRRMADEISAEKDEAHEPEDKT